MIRIITLLWLGLWSAWSTAATAAPRQLTFGALAYGTVNWELTVIKQQGLDRRHGFQLKVLKLANPQAGKIALQARAADMIVSDWLWVANQRGRGEDFTAIPYSVTHGALMVPPQSKISTLKDLAGKRLGVAGGALDKNWLLLQALARKRGGIDLAQQARPIYGAPPLLNQQLLQGRLDAVLNYWHYAAQLEARGYRRLLDGSDLLKGLGIEPTIPTLAYVFRERWGRGHRDVLTGFLRATQQAKQALCSDQEIWQAILPLTGTDDQNLQNILRQRYCEGQLQRWGKAELISAGQLYQILREVAGEAVTGPSPSLPEGTFWPDFSLPL